MVQFATIITDASWMQKDRSGSWAGTVISRWGRQEFHGKLKGEVLSSNYAELAGVANVLFCALREPLALKPEMGWLIQLDNAHVIRLLNFHFQADNQASKPFSPPHTERAEDTVVVNIDKMRIRMNPGFIFARHVKGHVAASDRLAAHHVQHRMDRRAAEYKRKS
jgi:ribonuclease HI